MTPSGEPRIELRIWSDDGCREVVFGMVVSIDIVQDLAPADDPNARGWYMAKEPTTVRQQRIEMTGIDRVVHHAPGYMTPEQKRVQELEAEVAGLERQLQRCEEGS